MLLSVPRFALAALLAVAACAEPAPRAPSDGAPSDDAPSDGAPSDSAFALLRDADPAMLGEAFERLGGRAYTITRRTEQLGEDGAPIASHTLTLRVTPSGTEVLAADSSGAFDFGGFERFADRRRAGPSAAPPVLPTDPAYLEPQGREAFAFEPAGDTLIGDRRVRIAAVRARPGEGDDQPLRAARLYVDAAGAVVGAIVDRRQESVLFGEASRRTLFLRPSPDGWLPDRLTVASEVRAPLVAPRRFRLDERYAYDG